eukprot:gnl/Ergobibamus_cyprinoides/1255.p1 GENE.gnl/Ergobibamus_cyprinoides/1255~~gnl/Ergobibamus_cyprinoides/1255.p1  ORF type:complete len:475 (-),score=156.99 gnl/Ergobibamus_cyprinoides/1255:109-1533(-)
MCWRRAVRGCIGAPQDGDVASADDYSSSLDDAMEGSSPSEIPHPTDQPESESQQSSESDPEGLGALLSGVAAPPRALPGADMMGADFFASGSTSPQLDEDFLNQDIDLSASASDEDEAEGLSDEGAALSGPDPDADAMEEDSTEPEDAEPMGALGPLAGSRLSQRLKRQAERVAAIEDELVGDKRWQMTGEVTAAQRPANSLLREARALEFEARRPDALVTDDILEELDALICARIKEGDFDDPVRREVANDTAASVAPISTAKPSKGLAEEFEAEFLAEAGVAAAPDVSIEEARAAAAEAWRELSYTLDALAAFNSVPRPRVADPTIKSFAPDIVSDSRDKVVVDVAPGVTPLTSTGLGAGAVAPQEVAKGAKRAQDLKSRDELTQDERRRSRASAKRAIRARHATEAVEARRAEKLAAAATAEGAPTSVGPRGAGARREIAAAKRKLAAGGGVGAIKVTQRAKGPKGSWSGH